MAQANKTEVFDRLYAQLNPEQRQAVDAIEGVVIVLAGPGTGKTQILAMRIAKILLTTQMDPYNILCLTFTESGVAAMRKRLLSIIGETAYYVRIHTFHSFCNDIIREFPEKFTFARELEVLSEVERVELFRQILDTLPANSPLKPYGSPYLYIPDLIRNIQSLKQEHISSEQYGQLLDTITEATSAIKPKIKAFTELSTKERTQKKCNQLLESILDKQDEYPTLATHFSTLRRLSEKYSKNSAVADSAKEVSKLNTKLKNDLKRWFDRLHNQLPKQRAIQTVYDAYQAHLQERGRYDYEDMILFVVQKFKTDEELLAHYQEQFQYMLVDEYQDTNGAQNETVFLLGQYDPNPNIFVVGDDKQSIYRFQGASLQNLLFLYEQYGQTAQVITLKSNYRSQQTILDAAHTLIQHNEESIERYIPGVSQELKSTVEYPAIPVSVIPCSTTGSELYTIGQRVKQLLAEGVAPQEIAVLYRRNADADDLAETLLKLGIPIQVEHGDNVLTDGLIKQMLTLLRYIADPWRMDRLWQVLQFEWLGLDPLDVLRLQGHAAINHLSLLEVLSDGNRLATLNLSATTTLGTLAERLARWQQLATTRPLPDFLTHIWQESGFVDYLLYADNHVHVLNRLNSLFTEAKRLYRRQPDLSLVQFIAYVDLLVEHDIVLKAEVLQTKQQAVRLMTAHKAKGLEFAHVFIAHAVDHHWGNLRERSKVPLPPGLLKYDTIHGQENNEDERRLFYVAMTRAKEQLTITYSEQNDQGRAQVPTIFLAELLPEQVKVSPLSEATPIIKDRLQTATLPAIGPSSEDHLLQYLQSLLDQYVMSVTHLNNYLTCPRIFYYRNLLRVPTVKNKQMALGTAVHVALSEFCGAMNATTMPPLEHLLESFTRALAKETLTAAEHQDTLSWGETLLRSYYERTSADCNRHNLLEYDFHSHHVTVHGIPLTGQIDKIEVIDEAKKLVNVVDYKTGNPDSKRAELQPGGDYHRQLVFYQLLCNSSPRFPYTMTSGEIDFIQASPKTGKAVKKKYAISEADLQELTQTIQEVWRHIHEFDFLDPTNPAMCGECEYCVAASQATVRQV